MSDRFLTADVAEGLQRQDEAPGEGFAAVGPWLEVHFPAANTDRDVQHALDEIPTGYHLILEVGGHVKASNLTAWTKDLAFLQADTTNTRVRLRFVLTREDPIHA